MPDSPFPDPERPAEPTACVILAAGASRRFGSPKQLAMVDGSTLLENTVQAALATPGLWPVIVVVGAGAAKLRPLLAPHPVLVTENPAWEEGLASSLRAGLDTALTFSRQIRAVIFTVCDQPALNSTALQTLLQRRAACGCSAVAARYDDHPGTPALLHAQHFGKLAHLTGDEGARKILQSLPPEELDTVDCPQLSLDVDTPADLARARGEA